MTIRAIFALIAGLLAAAVAGTAAFLTLNDSLDLLAVPRLIWSMPLIGAFVTAPGWVIALMVVLPVVTHRVARKPVPIAAYYLIASTAGAVSPLVSPFGLYIVSSDETAGVIAIMLACGAVGGISFAACWHVIVLKPLADRRAASWESFHG